MYSVEPSCGSASSLVIPMSLRCTGEEGLAVEIAPSCCPAPASFAGGCGVALRGVNQGEETRGGFGSYVKIDAM